jgi:ribosome-associated translation inhibitor RaiA
MRRLVAEALLDPSETWPLIESALRFWCHPDGDDAREVLDELQLVGHLEQWRMRAENCEALERRLMELKRIRAQLRLDKEPLDARRNEITAKIAGSKTQTLTIHLNGQRVYSDLTKLIDSLSAELAKQKKNEPRRKGPFFRK